MLNFPVCLDSNYPFPLSQEDKMNTTLKRDGGNILTISDIELISLTLYFQN